MRQTTDKFSFLMPRQQDIVDIDDINGNMEKLDGILDDISNKLTKKADIAEWKLLPLVCDSGSKLYYKKIDKLVCMKGVVIWNSTQNLPQTIAILPEGFRPYPSVSMLTMKRGVYDKIGFVSISIESDGSMVLIANSTDPQTVSQSGGLDLNITFSIN